MKSYDNHKHLHKYYDSLLNQSEELSKCLQYSYIFMEYCQCRIIYIIKSNFAI